MPPPLRKRVEAHPILTYQSISCDITAVYTFSADEKHVANEPATNPPTRSMTLMVPGLGVHLPVLEPPNEIDRFVTVRQVLEHIHVQLCESIPNEKSRAIRGTRQMACAREECRKREKSMGSVAKMNDMFFKTYMKSIDMLGGRTVFRGLRNQPDAHGANIWVVALERKDECAKSPVLHRELSPGSIVWDFMDDPLKVLHRQGKDIHSQSAFTSRKSKALCLTDLSGCFNIKVEPSALPSSGGGCELTVGDILTAIHRSMHVKYSDNEWEYWDPASAQKRKEAMAKFQTLKRKRGAGNGTTNPKPLLKSGSETYLDTSGDEDRRFLGIWRDIDTGGDEVCTLLKQPSYRPLPRLNKVLRPGGVIWSILKSPKAIFGNTFMESFATKPPRLHMCITIELMPGEKWKIDVHKALSDEYITGKQVIRRIYQYLVLDWYSNTGKRLPIHLREEISRNARKREEQNSKDGVVVIPGFKKVDMMRKSTFGGLKHYINDVGEDEWKLRLV